MKNCKAVTCPPGKADHVPFQGVTHEPCFLELNPVVVPVFQQLVPHWSPISRVLPFVGRLGPARAEVGLGFAVVGWFRRFCPPPLRWSWSVSVSLRFSFPLPLQGLPAPGVGSTAQPLDLDEERKAM